MDTMAIDQYMEEAVPGNYSNDNTSPRNRKSISNDTLVDSDENPSSGFDCNICLDTVQDPVVTLCGHLYCWPCIYEWLHLHSISPESDYMQPQQQCPVCRTEVSDGALVPLFGRGQTRKPSTSKVPNMGTVIPRRPLGLACAFDSPRSSSSTTSPRQTQQTYNRNHPHRSQLYYSQPGSHSSSPMLTPHVTAGNMLDIGMFGEMIYARVFGNSATNMYSYSDSYHLAGSNSPRLRRHLLQADKFLSRICFFIFCCVFLCFLSF